MGVEGNRTNFTNEINILINILRLEVDMRFVDTTMYSVSCYFLQETILVNPQYEHHPQLPLSRFGTSHTGQNTKKKIDN